VFGGLFQLPVYIGVKQSVMKELSATEGSQCSWIRPGDADGRGRSLSGSTGVPFPHPP